VERLLKEARIPRRYEMCDIESYKPHTVMQRKALSEVKHYLGKYPHQDFGLLFLGPCGVGKTHLSVAILRHVISQFGDEGIFYDFRDLLRAIQGSWNSVSQTSELEVLRPVLDAKVLVLDELGANKPTEWVRDTVAHIINCRYNDKNLTVFTSNYPDDPATGYNTPPRLGDFTSAVREETLTDRIGLRLRSRLYEMCKTITIDGEDFRKTIRQANYLP
jgi:DNA replication protein DnaC